MLDLLLLLAQSSPFPTNPTAPPPGPPPEVVFAIVGVVFLVFFAIWAGICYMLYINLKAVPEEYRRMPPGQVWLLLIPLFNLVWNFFVFQRIPESYQNLFYSRGRTDVGDAGKGIGLWYSIAAACSIVPCLNYIAGPAALVLLIIFFVKVFGLKGQVPQVVMMQAYAAPGSTVPGAFPVGFPPPPLPATGYAPPPPPPPPYQQPPPQA